MLDLFSKGSGQRINVDKSIVLAPKNAHRPLREVFHDFSILSSPGDDFSYLSYHFLKILRSSTRIMPCVHKTPQRVES